MSTTYCRHHPVRREEVKRLKTLNGIDYLEVAATDQKSLKVFFIFNLPGETDAVPPAPKLTKENFVIDGGVRVKGIKVEGVATDKNTLLLKLNGRGDFSTYMLRLVSAPDQSDPPDGFDPQLARMEFSFKVECPSEFDCLTKTLCPPAPLTKPDIDYLAKDYAGFRRLLLDRLSVIMPDWQEPNPADLLAALVELLAYAGDHLSYFQDAVAAEAYLGTARKRISVRRHARLLDYPMHDGCNARAWVCLTVKQDDERTNGTQPAPVPKNAKFLITKEPPPNDPQEYATWLRRAQPVFEPAHEVHGLYRAHNQISFYTWSDELCCLPNGATRATLQDSVNMDHRLRLRTGDILVFEEIAGQEIERPRRHAVRLTRVEPETIEEMDDDGVVTRKPGDMKIDLLTGQPIVEIEWDAEDALCFPLCLSALRRSKDTGNDERIEVSVARGNMVLVGHGLTIENEPLVPDTTPECGEYRPRLARGPLTFQAPVDAAPPLSAAATLRCVPHDALPCIHLTVWSADGGQPWFPHRDLLASTRSSDAFVVETESDGVAHLRFGDDTLGHKPNPGVVFRATYRVGNGPAGNIGAETIQQVLHASTAIERVHNPLPAQGGTAPESIERVRQNAPHAFRRQERAVTEADYATVAGLLPGIQKAAARFRWTGSWYTAFVAVDRTGGLAVDDAFKQKVRRHLEHYRLAGYDIEIQGAEYVPLNVAMMVCVKPHSFRGIVKEALRDRFSNRKLPDGRYGFFNPDNFTFGQPVYLSALYEAAMSVAGVASVDITQFQRWGQAANRELDDAVLTPGGFQIVQLDNDPNFPEHGKIEFTMEGGL